MTVDHHADDQTESALLVAPRLLVRRRRVPPPRKSLRSLAAAMALHYEIFCGLGANLAKSKSATDLVAWELSRAFWTAPKFEGPNGWQSDATRHYPPRGGWAPYFPTARDVCRHKGDVEARQFAVHPCAACSPLVAMRR